MITSFTSELTTGDLIRHMVGRDVSLFPKAQTPVGDVLLEVRGLKTYLPVTAGILQRTVAWFDQYLK